MRLILPLLFAAATLAPAQMVSFGVKAGVPVTAALPYYFDYGSNMLDTGRWTIGPTFEFRLIYGFSVEAEALYRGYRQVSSSAAPEFTQGDLQRPPIYFSNRQSTKVWDFPLLLKYRFTAGPLHPFVDAGYTWSHESSDETSTLVCLSSSTVCGSSNLQPYYSKLQSFSHSRNHGGPTAGVGVEFKFGKFKLAPEVRYTRFRNPNSNSATLLVGFTF